MNKKSKNRTTSMKSRPLGTKLRLFKIARWLGLVVCIKLAVLLALLFDLPMRSPGSAFFVETPVGTAVVDESMLISGTGGVAHAAGLIGNEAENATEPVSAPCPDTIDPMLRKTLERKQVDLDRREQELNGLEGRINEKIEEMQALEGRIQMMLKDAQQVQDEKLRHLVDVYSNMKAKQAGQVLETLDERTAVRILAGMRGRQAGEILNNITPEKAARLSEMLTRMQLPFN